MRIDTRTYNLLRISLAFGAGSNKAVKICEQLHKEGLPGSSPDVVINSGIFDEKSRGKIKAVKPSEIEAVIKDCDGYGIRIVTLFDEEYPERLKNIPVPPVLLYVKGNLPDVDTNPLFCIVGPRRISEFGKKAAFSLARRLSKAGMTVVSGAAAGADTSVHLGAADAKSASVMVTADGIITKMNSGNRELYKTVLERGAIISENPPRAVAGKYGFPVRNRIMSGISVGVAVVEAPQKSGALITAGHALEQDRDVFVVPGCPSDKRYEGSNALLRDGAIPLLDASDVFSRYIFHFPEKIDVEKAFSGDDRELKKNSQKKSVQSLSNEARLVYNNLVKPEFTVDDLLNLDIDGAALLSALTELEMEHLISSLPGGLYKIIV